jgi:hypothetical protein
MHKPTISDDAALTQAGATIKQYLHQAVESIDDVFGKDYARKNPDLVAACVQAQAADYNTVAQTAALYELATAVESVAGEISGIAENLDSRHS